MPKLDIGKLYVVRSHGPSVHRTENGRFFPYEGPIRRPMVVFGPREMKAVGKLLDQPSAASGRFYLAEFLGPGLGNVPEFKAVLRLRLSWIDREETDEDAPGLDEVSRFLDGDEEALVLPSAPSLR